MGWVKAAVVSGFETGFEIIYWKGDQRISEKQCRSRWEKSTRIKVDFKSELKSGKCLKILPQQGLAFGL
jgi:hypothetical protein